MSLYLAGAFTSFPELPRLMEGEVELPSDTGHTQIYHVDADFDRKIVQLTLISPGTHSYVPPRPGRRLLSHSNVSLDHTPRVVVQDYNKVTTSCTCNISPAQPYRC